MDGQGEVHDGCASLQERCYAVGDDSPLCWLPCNKWWGNEVGNGRGAAEDHVPLRPTPPMAQDGADGKQIDRNTGWMDGSASVHEVGGSVRPRALRQAMERRAEEEEEEEE